MKVSLRHIPCLGCVRSALKGMSIGDCWDTAGKGKRCERCSHGHKCEEVPDDCKALSRRFVLYLARPLPNNSEEARRRDRSIKRDLRTAVKMALDTSLHPEDWDKYNSVGGDSSDDEDDEDDDSLSDDPFA